MTANPTSRISVDFSAWKARRERREAFHMIGGVPDYAFSMDVTLRRKLEAVPALRLVGQALTAAAVPIQRALMESDAVAVGPNQIPRVHRMGVACAERLGIGVPQIFIMQDPIPNAFTFATNDVDQIVVLTSGLVDIMDDDELQFVIGHECGHIHSRHVVYNTIYVILTDVIAQGLLNKAGKFLGPIASVVSLAFTAATFLVLGRWHRCAEVTCDRAGLICTPNIAAAERVNAKLHMGGLGKLDGFNPEEYQRQTKTYSKSWIRVKELIATHPPGPRRAEAIKLYLGTDVFASWRPEVRGRAAAVPQAQVDAHVEGLFL